jgi:hypothetical protein
MGWPCTTADSHGRSKHSNQELIERAVSPGHGLLIVRGALSSAGFIDA